MGLGFAAQQHDLKPHQSGTMHTSIIASAFALCWRLWSLTDSWHRRRLSRSWEGPFLGIVNTHRSLVGQNSDAGHHYVHE